ncbi:hypothetical protein CDAR_76541 [Caerostris darwini]|uniref:Uncharacterized protein n=1 Tax=Caerostris darwini TaxID=1538125 RepID=A0AAV4QHJ6_9ARAC|nr:hypothetical protein CDAR_76541 [Caerostris darwini]
MSRGQGAGAAIEQRRGDSSVRVERGDGKGKNVESHHLKRFQGSGEISNHTCRPDPIVTILTELSPLRSSIAAPASYRLLSSRHLSNPETSLIAEGGAGAGGHDKKQTCLVEDVLFFFDEENDTSRSAALLLRR